MRFFFDFFLGNLIKKKLFFSRFLKFLDFFVVGFFEFLDLKKKENKVSTIKIMHKQHGSYFFCLKKSLG